MEGNDKAFGNHTPDSMSYASKGVRRQRSDILGRVVEQEPLYFHPLSS